MRIAWYTLLGAAVAATGCASERPVGSIPIDNGSVPTMPTAMPGSATLSGVVTDKAGTPIAGARVLAAETDAAATTDATGAYRLVVPSDSTTTVVTSADGFGKTYRESVVLAANAVVTGFDIHLLPAADITAQNALAVSTAPETRGLVALRFHSLTAGCSMAGAHVTVWPNKAATVMYGANTTDSMNMPDPTAGAISAGVPIGAWLVGTMPAGNMLDLATDSQGCTPLSMSPSMDGLMFTGLFRVDAQALTEVDLFVDQAP